MTVDDASAAVVRFRNGALGTIEASRFATGRKNYNAFEINGSKGSIAFNLERLNELEVYLSGDDPAVQGFHNVMVTEGQHHPYVGHWWPPGHIIGYEHTFINQCSDIVTAVAEGKAAQLQPDFANAAKTQAVLDAALESSAKRKWVETDC